MRLLVTLAALALGAPSWSAQCSANDTAAVMEKINKYIFPSPDSQEFRRMAWTQANSDDERVLIEYSGLRVLVSCNGRISKADELNGIELRGEIDFKYEAARFMDFPEITASGVQLAEWSDWVEQRETLNPGVIFRKFKGMIQLQREFVGPSYSDPLSTAYIDDFFKNAATRAAKLREAEAAEQRAAEAAAAEEQARPKAKIVRPANPYDYYPPASIRREEEGSPTVLACVSVIGKLIREPTVTDTSGFPDLDHAAIKVATNMAYAPGKDERGNPARLSCVKFKVKFSLHND